MAARALSGEPICLALFLSQAPPPACARQRFQLRQTDAEPACRYLSRSRSYTRLAGRSLYMWTWTCAAVLACNRFYVGGVSVTPVQTFFHPKRPGFQRVRREADRRAREDWSKQRRRKRSPARESFDGGGGGGEAGGGGGGGGGGHSGGGRRGDGDWSREMRDPGAWPPDPETLAEMMLVGAGTSYSFAWMMLDRFDDIDVEKAPLPIQALYGLLNLLQFAGVVRLAQLAHPYAAAAARRAAMRSPAFLFDFGVEYAATVFALVYAVMLGALFGDTSGHTRRESSHREAGDLYTVVLEARLMSGERGAEARRGFLRDMHEYVCCIAALDFGREAHICSQCAGLTNRIEQRLLRLADDGPRDKVNRVNLSAALAALRAADESRSIRIAAFDPHMTWMLACRIRGLAIMLSGGFLFRSTGAPRLDALVWGLLVGVFVKLDQVCEDIAEWTSGEYKISPIAFEHLAQRLEAEMRELGMEPQPRESYIFDRRRARKLQLDAPAAQDEDSLL